MTEGNNIQIPDSIGDKMGTIVTFIIIIIFLWLSNTGRLNTLIGLFQQAGYNIRNNVASVVPPTTTVAPYNPINVIPIGSTNTNVPYAPPLPGLYPRKVSNK